MDYVLKFYRRVPGVSASKVIDRLAVIASDKAEAVSIASRAERPVDCDFAMLFVEGGDVVWVSEGADA